MQVGTDDVQRTIQQILFHQFLFYSAGPSLAVHLIHDDTDQRRCETDLDQFPVVFFPFDQSAKVINDMKNTIAGIGFFFVLSLVNYFKGPKIGKTNL